MLTHYTEELPDIIIIHLNGSLTREYLKEAEDTWNEQLKKRPEVLALNLRGLMTIDSISLNHFFNLSKKAAARDVKLIIYDVSDELRNLFELIKLESLVTIMTDKKFHETYVRTSNLK
ncbi:MAG TPA: STAS domain-containing protein [Spirochaetota bacterium]|nr:STAS domain-containing protein [Spirochaetota bacterium]HPI88455.1 STAS domain-containing protein [Spirochaetota bacterium]HPR48818.1 STAS domain-containing protein [Spirochaetota bacterium]